jgi:hypothetical protein
MKNFSCGREVILSPRRWQYQIVAVLYNYVVCDRVVWGVTEDPGVPVQQLLATLLYGHQPTERFDRNKQVYGVRQPHGQDKQGVSSWHENFSIQLQTIPRRNTKQELTFVVLQVYHSSVSRLL